MDFVSIFNPILVSAFFGWFIAQLIKLIFDLVEGKKVNIDILFRTGGMPSSHASFVTAITSTVYFLEGASNLFFVAFGFSMVVLTDAFGVRWQVGNQAKLLNMIIKEMKKFSKKHNVKLLKELVGHSGLQVFFGVVTGILVSLFVNFVLF